MKDMDSSWGALYPWLKGHFVCEDESCEGPPSSLSTLWFLSDSSFFSVIQAPNIRIDSYDENSLSFTLSMDGDIKVIQSSQTGSWARLSSVQELL